MTKKLLAYHGKPELKEQVLRDLRVDYSDDKFRDLICWKNRKGHVVEVFLEDKKDISYEERLGIPISLGHLQDAIFEGLPHKKDKEFLVDFMDAFEVGKDYSSVSLQFIRWILLDYLLPQVNEKGTYHDKVRELIKNASELDENTLDYVDNFICFKEKHIELASIIYAAYSVYSVFLEKKIKSLMQIVTNSAYAVCHNPNVKRYVRQHVKQEEMGDLQHAACTLFANKIIELIKKA